MQSIHVVAAALAGITLLSNLDAADPAVGALGAVKKPEIFLLLPEPRAMRSSVSRPLWGAVYTVFTPAQEAPDQHSVETYSKEEFARLGIGWGTYLEKCRASADLKLAAMQPSMIKNDAGETRYAVYRGSDPGIGCLLIAPSLLKIFGKSFGDTLWLVTPDRNSLFVFPAKSKALQEFAADLKDRFETNPMASSDEIFELTKDGLRVVGNFSGRQPEEKTP